MAGLIGPSTGLNADWLGIGLRATWGQMLSEVQTAAQLYLQGKEQNIQKLI